MLLLNIGLGTYASSWINSTITASQCEILNEIFSIQFIHSFMVKVDYVLFVVIVIQTVQTERNDLLFIWYGYEHLSLSIDITNVIQIARNAIIFPSKYNFMFWTKLPFQVYVRYSNIVWDLFIKCARFIFKLFKLD